MFKISNEQAYEIGVKIALQELGLEPKTAAGVMPGALPAAAGAMPQQAAMAAQPQPRPQPVPPPAGGGQWDTAGNAVRSAPPLRPDWQTAQAPMGVPPRPAPAARPQAALAAGYAPGVPRR